VITLPKLSSGLIIAGAYADKIRRTLFAQLRDLLKQGKVSAQKIALAAGTLNRMLYNILVERLKVDKGDVVRIRIDYDVTEAGEIVWNYETLELEVFRREPQDKVNAIIKEVIAKAEEIVTAAVIYGIEKIGETIDGDVVYTIKLDEREVGAVEITPINEEMAFLKKGAVTEPSPVVIEKVKLDIREKSMEDAIRDAIAVMARTGRHVEASEAIKVINYLRERVAAKPVIEEVKYEELEESS